MRERRETRGGAVRRPRAKAERSEPKRREVNDMSEPTGMNVVRHEAGPFTSVSAHPRLPLLTPFLRHSRSLRSPRMIETFMNDPFREVKVESSQGERNGNGMRETRGSEPPVGPSFVHLTVHSLSSASCLASPCLIPFALHPRLHPTPYRRVGSLHSPPTPFGREPAARME